MAFTFRYTEVRYGQSEWAGRPEGVTILGELVSGEMALGEKITLPLRSGCQFEEIVRRVPCSRQGVTHDRCRMVGRVLRRRYDATVPAESRVPCPRLCVGMGST